MPLPRHRSADEIELPRRRRCDAALAPQRDVARRDRHQRRCSCCRHGESREERHWRRGGSSRGASGYSAAGETRAHPDRILTDVRVPHLRVFPAYAFHARGVLFASLVAGALALGLATAAAAAGPRVLVAELDNDINPVTQQYLQDQVRRGERDGYAAVVIELDTPGGLGSSMRKIVKTLLAAKVPVIVYVAPAGLERRLGRGGDRPGGGRAGDGAADEHRLVHADHDERAGLLEGPATEDRQRRSRLHRRARARARPQRPRGRGDGAQRRELRCARGAPRGTSSTPSLRACRSCSTASTAASRSRKGSTLHTAGAQVDRVEMSFWKRALDLLIDPNIIALMLSLGVVGILVELWHPGLIFPGTVGAISLIVGLYGLQVLPGLGRRGAPAAPRGRLLRS